MPGYKDTLRFGYVWMCGWFLALAVAYVPFLIADIVSDRWEDIEALIWLGIMIAMLPVGYGLAKHVLNARKPSSCS